MSTITMYLRLFFLLIPMLDFVALDNITDKSPELLIKTENSSYIENITSVIGTTTVTYNREETIPNNGKLMNPRLKNLGLEDSSKVDILSEDSLTRSATTNQSFQTRGRPRYVQDVAFPSTKTFSHTGDGCSVDGSCELLLDNTCLGETLPYNHTSNALTNFTSQREAREHLELWWALRNIPRCWAVVQPFLCAVFFPSCNGSIMQLPSQEMCIIVQNSCQVVQQEGVWPDYLRCKDDYPSSCKNPVKEVKFNTTGVCSEPLVATESEEYWYPGVKGCGVQCAEPAFSQNEHLDFQRFVATLGGICLACSAFTVLTYLIDWRSANKYPALIILYINVCFLVASIAFMVQFDPEVRQELLCRKDNTLRLNEPSPGGQLSCVVVFVCIYYFMVAAGMWLIILAYAWHGTFKSLAGGSAGEELERRAAYFHLLAWSIPLVLTITILALAQVSANYLSGVCFLDPSLHIRVVFLIIPLIIVASIAGYFLAQGLMTLIRLKTDCSNIISGKANSKILETIIRMVVFTAALFIFLTISICCHIYYHQNYKDWENSLRKYIMCKMNISSLSDSAVSGYPGGSTKCLIESRPSMALYKLHLLSFFGSGIAMSSWVWTSNTLDAWRRFLRRVLGITEDQEVHLAKHKVIAQAFAKRHHLNNIGRLSISLHSMHHDPVGLNFDINSGTSGDMSSAWAMAIPQLMARRGALVGGTAALTVRRNSVDSEYSVSRRYSMESGAAGGRGSSRRHSLDSQLSFHVSDVERMAAIHTAARFGSRRKRREWFSLRRGKKKVSPWDRRGSNTSDSSNLTSNLGSMILPAITLNQETLFANMMKRLNLSSEDPTRGSEIGVGGEDPPSVSPTKSRNQQTNTPSDDETGAENPGYIESDSMCQTIEGGRRRKTEHCAGGKRKKNSYLQSAIALEEGLLHTETRDMATQVEMMDVGIQVSIPASVTTTIITTSNKSCQVSTPLLVRASKNRTNSQESQVEPENECSDSSNPSEKENHSDKLNSRNNSDSEPEINSRSGSDSEPVKEISSNGRLSSRNKKSVSRSKNSKKSHRNSSDSKNSKVNNRNSSDSEAESDSYMNNRSSSRNKHENKHSEIKNTENRHSETRPGTPLNRLTKRNNISKISSPAVLNWGNNNSQGRRGAISTNHKRKPHLDDLNLDENAISLQEV